MNEMTKLQRQELAESLTSGVLQIIAKEPEEDRTAALYRFFYQFLSIQ
jgi:hypothetical protein